MAANGSSTRLTCRGGSGGGEPGVQVPEALIVGAGIGGLAAGVALQRSGWQVRIHERAARPRELGFALALAPNAIAALDELGLSRTVVAAGVAATRFEVRRVDGRLLRRFTAPPGGAGVIALRAALHGTLLKTVGEQSLTSSSDIVSFSQDATRVRLINRDGRIDTGDLLIGADGVGSVIRTQLHPQEPSPMASGFYAVRGLARAAAAHLGDLVGVGYFGDGVEAATVRASEEAVYWYLSLLAEDVASLPREPRVISERITRRFDSRLRAVIAATDESDMRLDELFVRRPLTAWGAGRVTLLGDAAHPVLPHTGQGAAQALEDAVALDLALRRNGDVTRALREYERVRSRRTKRLMAVGPRIARMTTTRNPVRKLVRTALIRFIPEFVLLKAVRPGDPHRSLRQPGADAP
jgi:2-polyprenyl-6-methoxyphenol hydroxylase-like FAD-dependent oxidoreductase